MSTRQLDPLFDPSSLAIVGASPDSWYSSRIFEHLTGYGYDGDLYLVNPNREAAWDRTCYDGVSDLPEVVDLAVVVVPREHVVDVVREAGEVGIPAALVITTGFSEADERGAELEAELEATAAEYEINVAGPNCIGLANAQAGTVLLHRSRERTGGDGVDGAVLTGAGTGTHRPRQPVGRALLRHLLRKRRRRGHPLLPHRLDG